MAGNFDQALGFTLKAEGGFFSDRRSTCTDHGIRQDIYDDYCRRRGLVSHQVQSLTKPEIMEFYRTEYWERTGCPYVPDPGLAMVLFDTAVHCGQRTAVKLLQRALNDCHYTEPINDDGILGYETRGALDATPAMAVMQRLLDRRQGLNERINDAEFERGWFNRLRSLQAAAVKVIWEA